MADEPELTELEEPIEVEPVTVPAQLREHVYKRPESVLVAVCTRGGEFLMLRRTRPAGFWQSVTGSLGWEESPREAALRELREETGLAVAKHDLVDLHHTERFTIRPAWRARYAPGEYYNREHWFALVLPRRRSVRLNPGEHVESRWLDAYRAAALATSWTNRDAILRLAGWTRVA